nr:unnamed protein product [Haemonchus contortus]
MIVTLPVVAATAAVIVVASALLPSSPSSSTPQFFDFTNGTGRLRFANDDSLVLLHNYGPYVLLGGRNAVFNVSITPLSLIFKYEWPTSENDMTECTKKTTSLIEWESYSGTIPSRDRIDPEQRSIHQEERDHYQFPYSPL